MQLLTLLTQFAENAHHQIPISELIESESIIIREAFTMNNTQLRNLLGNNNINYADRDAVVVINK